MATRVLIFHRSGAAIFGLNTLAGDDHAAQWIVDSVEILAQQGVTEVFAVEFDVDEGADAARTEAIRAGNIRAELREFGGRLELVSVYRNDSRLPNGRGHRIVFSAIAGLAGAATVHGRGVALLDLAERWRAHNPRAWPERRRP